MFGIKRLPQGSLEINHINGTEIIARQSHTLKMSYAVILRFRLKFNDTFDNSSDIAMDDTRKLYDLIVFN